MNRLALRTTSASLHLPSLQSTFGRLSHRSAHSPFASEYLGHVSTISEDFITHSRITHHYTFEYSTRTTTCLKNLRKHTNISPTTSPKHHVHRHTSPNIIPARHMLSPNIRYNSYTPRRLLTGSSRTFAHSPFNFLSTPDMMVRISESFYCAKICTGTHSGIHPLWHLYSHCLKFSLDFGSIVKHTTSSPPFLNSLVPTCSSLISFIFPFLFLSPFAFLSISFTSFVFHVSDLCPFILIFHITLFRIFSNICTLMYL
jgi:hypothetical protein